MTLLTSKSEAQEINGLAFSQDPKRRIAEHIAAYRKWLNTHQFASDTDKFKARVCLMYIEKLRPDSPWVALAGIQKALDELEAVIHSGKVNLKVNHINGFVSRPSAGNG